MLALELLNYTYLIVGIALLLCTFVVTKRYTDTKNKIMPLFILFLMIFMISSVLGFAVGLFEAATFEAAIIQRIGLGLGVAAAAQFAVFLLFPLRPQLAGSWKAYFALLLPIIFYIFAGISLLVLLLDVFAATPFWVILGLLGTSIVNVVILLAVTLGEKDPQYRNRTMILLIGYATFVVASLIRDPAFLFIEPLLMTAGVLLMTVSVLRQV
ncbi:MAG: hypothetical protein ACTSV2_14030 [Candidatus Thorarchaeota archaeon]